MSFNNNIPNKQRALVLQGGGALGAYESGVLTVLCKELMNIERDHYLILLLVHL
jgi:NTE family protein